MARKQRIHYNGALYHVICRGNNKNYVFKEAASKKMYLEIIEHYKRKYGFNLYCYCLMDNHVHMLIEVGKEPLSKIMKCVQQVYTQRYNKTYNRTGHVFEQRYKAVLCDKNQYLLSLINYIHMNPERAGLPNGINHEWSSHNAYVEGRNTIVDVDFPLSLFEGTKEQQRERYLKYMKFEEDDIGKMKPYEFSDDMLDLVKQKLNDTLKENECKKYSSQEVIDKVCRFYNIDENELKIRSRAVIVVHRKRVLANLLKNHTGLINIEIGQLLNMSPSAISFALVDESVQEKIEEDMINIGISGA